MSDQSPSKTVLTRTFKFAETTVELDGDFVQMRKDFAQRGEDSD